MPLFNEWLTALVPVFPRFVRESLAMTLAALVFSLPISAAQFSLVPLLSPLANIVATPFLSLLLAGGFIGIAFSAFLPQVLVLVLLLTKAFIVFIVAIASVPGAALPVDFELPVALGISFALAVAIWAFWPTPRSVGKKHAASFACAFVICVCLVGFIHPSSNGDRIIMLDVGQGDSFVLSSEGHNLLIDTGNEPEMLYAALARNGITSLDAVLITHPDDDHCGSLKNLADVAQIGSIVVAEGLSQVDEAKVQTFLSTAKDVVGAARIREVGRGDTIRFGIFELDIVAPQQVEHEGGNEDSICLYARADCDKDGTSDWNAFFCGDAEAGVLEELQSARQLEHVDIYKVGHHGSRKALTPELAQALSPKIALIGVGENSYGHPTQETLDTLEAVSAKVYRSDLDGDVVCELSLDSLHFTAQRSCA